MPEQEHHLCPRRVETPPGYQEKMAPDGDTWRPPRNPGSSGMGDNYRTCSWCGSVHPDEFMQALKDGKQLGPTDKNYKAYLDEMGGKFYYQHLRPEQMQEFIKLYNDKKINVGYPGHLYVVPYFCVRAPKPEAGT